MRVDSKMLVDIVDLDNTVIGSMPREQVLPRHVNFRTVHVILTAPGDLWVLQKLRDDHPRSPGRIGSSVAGYLRAGETYQDAARRKLFNELRSKAKLHAIGGFSMPDEQSAKFIEVFRGRSLKRPDYDRGQIAGLVYLSEAEVHERMIAAPDQFTETFQYVFRFIRGQTT